MYNAIQRLNNWRQHCNWSSYWEAASLKEALQSVLQPISLDQYHSIVTRNTDTNDQRLSSSLRNSSIHKSRPNPTWNGVAIHSSATAWALELEPLLKPMQVVEQLAQWHDNC